MDTHHLNFEANMKHYSVHREIHLITRTKKKKLFNLHFFIRFNSVHREIHELLEETYYGVMTTRTAIEFMI